jgi:hypothetical protein
MFFGAGSGSTGSGSLRHYFQNGVKTWNGLSLLFWIIHGSCRSAALRLSTFKPSPRSPFFALASRRFPSRAPAKSRAPGCVG